ncbi:hypothetical protein [Modestobacter lacusdianchii]
MNTYIEVPARPIVEILALNGWHGEYNREEWRAVGLWWAKVLLLVGHPDSFLENPRLQKQVKLDFDSKPDLRWLTDGSGTPGHVSVFVHNIDYSATGAEHELIVPSHVLFDNGDSARCHMLSMATPNMSISVVSHPGIAIEHPLVRFGRAWELLHSPPRRGDIGDLEPLSRDNVRYLQGGGVPEGHVVDASETSRLAALFSIESDRLGPGDPATAARPASTPENAPDSAAEEG